MSLVSDGATIFSTAFLGGNATTPQMTFFCWVKEPASTAGSQMRLCFSNTTNVTGANADYIGLVKTSASNQEAIVYNDDAAHQWSAVEAAVSQASTWVPVCGIITSGTSVRIITKRTNAANSITTGTIGVATYDLLQFLGRKTLNVAPTGFLNSGGMLAECAIWNAPLDASEANALLFGNQPPSRIRPGSLLCYMPLRWDAFDYGPMGLTFLPTPTTNTCTYVGDHPIMSGPQPIRRTWMLMPGLKRMAVSASDASASGVVRQTGLRRGATDAESARVVRLVGAPRGAVDAQTAAVRRVPAKLLSAADPQANGLVRAIAAIRSAAQTQSAAVVRLMGWRRGATQTNAATALAPATKLKAVSASDAESAAISALHSAVLALSAGSTQAAAVLRASAKLLGTSAASVATISRLLASRLTLSTASAVAIGQRRLVSAIRGVVGLQSTNRGVAVAKPLSVAAIAEATALALGRQTLRSFSAAQAQSARVLFVLFYSRALSAVTAASAALVRALGVLRSATTPQATSYRLRIGTVLTGATDPQSVEISPRYLAVRLLNAARSQSLGIARRAAHMLQLSAGLAQDLAVLGAFSSQHFYFVTLDVVADSVVVVARGTARAFAAFQRLAAGFVRWGHQYLPRALRSRVVWLPPPQAASSLPPSARRVLLPLENESMSGYQITQAEPQYFSPFDPSDEDTFTFDWSRRGYTNDRIVFASVTSVPAGVNFLGPAFIDGSLVDITVGPFTPLSLPFTYELRCRAVFASGRISNYSIPVVIMTL